MNKKSSNKPTIIQTLITKVLLIAIGSISLIGFLWIWSEFSEFRVESESMREKLLISHKEIIKNEVDKVVSYIEYKKKQVEKQLKQSIKERVYEAHDIALNIFEQHRDSRPPYDVRKMVKDALRPIRFNNGRGYYFAFNLKGIEELFADRPEMEGKDMLAVQNADGRYVVRDMLEIAGKKGEGFYEYTWTKPNAEGYFPKIAFVKLFKPLNWVIGVGEYPDDVENDIQAEVVEYMEQISYRSDGYVFATRWDGVSLTNPGKGQNNLEVTDVNGLKIVRELIRLSKKGKGYLEYVMPKMGGKRPAPKLAYVVGIPKWEWYVGAGIYIDEIETAIGQKRKAVKEQIFQHIVKILFIFFGLILFVSLLAIKVARKSKTNIDLFIDFFRKAAIESASINPDMIDFSELEILAHSANDMTRARNQAEKELRESEERLNLALDSVSDAVWDWRVDTDEVYFSSRWYTMLGYAPYELPQEFDTWRSLLHPEDLPSAEQTVFKHLDSGELFEIEFRMRTKDNRWKWVFARGKVVEKDTSGKALRMLGTHVDITDRKQAEKALVDSEQKWRHILVNTPQIGIALDPRARIVFANDHFLSLTGWQEQEVIGQDWFDMFIPEGVREEVRKVFSAVMSQKDTFGFSAYENEIITRSGELRNVAWSNLLTKDAEGNVVDVTCLGIDLTERKQAEEALRKSETKMRSIFRAAPIGIGVVSNRVIQDVNERFSELSGYSMDELIGKNARILYPTDEDYEYVGREKYRQIEKFGTGTVETRFKRKDGKIIDVLTSSTPLDPNDLSLGVTFTALDITERKQAEMALREKSQLLKEIIDSAQEGIIVYDNDLRYLIWNPFMERLSGCLASDVLGKHPLEVFPFLRETGVLERIEQALAGVVPPAIDFPYSLPEIGRSGWSLDASSPLRNAEGEIIGVIATVRDITDRKRAEEALKESESFTRAVLDNLPIGVAVNTVFPAVIFEYMNDNFPTYYRTDSAALAEPDAFWSAVYEDPGFREEIKKRVLDDCASGDPGRMYWEDVPITRKGDETTFITTRNIPIPNSQLMISTVWDVTERKQMEARLQQAQKMEAIGTLAGGIAHDFNNILTPLILHTEMIMEDLSEESPLMLNLDEMLKAGHRAKDLVKQILIFSRQGEQQKVSLKLSVIVKEVLNLLRAVLPSTIEIRQNLKSENDHIFADSIQVHQILMNLCTNAAHAMRKTGGILDVAMLNVYFDSNDSERFLDLRPGSYIKLTVSDTGHGMDSNTIKRIFEPYFTTKGRGEGTGMGLAVAHGIVTSHNGAIHVESEPEKGSSFEIYLPVIESAATQLQDIREDMPRGNEKILLVDDEKAIVVALKSMIERLGYSVTARTSGVEAMALFRNKPDAFDLVITDMTMPKLTGAELAKEFIKIRPDIAIILCTGFSDLISETTAKEIGIKGFVMKPILAKELARTIRKALDSQRLYPAAK
jgi:PAS domain S-box-containing protein